MITRHDVAHKLIDHLRHRLSLNELVAWAEDVMMTGELDEVDLNMLRTILSRLGLADVREFGLSWEDIQLRPALFPAIRTSTSVIWR